ncbi:MAG TPA: hypothetical protein VN578_17610 [Candidatus Binatia bacterium]|jgi:hypothetical protein|nr:hypothetical protein [Candidatus Binatia bacterium]
MTTPLFAVLDFMDYAVIAAIFAGGSAYAKGPDLNAQLLAPQMRDLQRKLDALLKHQGVEMPPPPPSGLSPEVERLASVPDGKIAAIKLYREQNPGVGLAEAKDKIEEFNKSRQ